MNYEEISANKTYIKYSECEVGQVLVEDATFKGVSKNKFDKLNFEFEKGGHVVVLNECGGLAYNYKEGKIKIGQVFKIIYDGKGVMKKGAYAGKEFHELKIFSAQGDVAAPAGTDPDQEIPY